MNSLHPEPIVSLNKFIEQTGLSAVISRSTEASLTTCRRSIPLSNASVGGHIASGNAWTPRSQATGSILVSRRPI